MEKIILLNNDIKSKREISELLKNKSYSTLFAENLTELILLMAENSCTKSFIYVRTLSDIRQLQTIQSLYPDLEVNLIIPPGLEEIIKLLKYNDFKIVNDVLQIS